VVAIVFMVLGALPFVMFIRIGHGDLKAPWRDAQVRGLLTFLAVVILLMTAWLWTSRDISLLGRFGWRAQHLDRDDDRVPQ